MLRHVPVLSLTHRFYRKRRSNGGLSTGIAPPPEGCRWRRVLLKLSGEALAGDAGFGIDADLVLHFAGEVASMQREGVQARARGRAHAWALRHHALQPPPPPALCLLP